MLIESSFAASEMNKSLRTHLPYFVWVAALALLVIVELVPVSNRATRAGGLILFIAVWFGFIGLYWHRRAIRFSSLGVTCLCAGFLVLPSRNLPPVDSLRRDYVAGLRHYEGVAYSWGGENLTGIDCSGLIRRGLIDAMFCRGIYTVDAGLVRRAASLWWADCSASDLGKARNGLTVHLFDIASINQLDHSKILAGDLAVTKSGAHIMAYLGHELWIEADPGVRRVITVSASEQANAWFNTPVKIVRWNIFSR